MASTLNVNGRQEVKSPNLRVFYFRGLLSDDWRSFFIRRPPRSCRQSSPANKSKDGAKLPSNRLVPFQSASRASQPGADAGPRHVESVTSTHRVQTPSSGQQQEVPGVRVHSLACWSIGPHRPLWQVPGGLGVADLQHLPTRLLPLAISPVLSHLRQLLPGLLCFFVAFCHRVFPPDRQHRSRNTRVFSWSLGRSRGRCPGERTANGSTPSPASAPTAPSAGRFSTARLTSPRARGCTWVRECACV